MSIRITADVIDAASEAAAFTAACPSSLGAVVTFTGLCRDEGGRITALHIEHYAEMAEVEIARMMAEARERFAVEKLAVVHRFGRITPGEVIVFVAAASAHRGNAFAAAGFVMDHLKTRAPFWKKTEGAEAGWIDSTVADERATAHWRGDT